MATHSSILAWKIPWTEEPGSPQGHKEQDIAEHTAQTESLLQKVETGRQQNETISNTKLTLKQKSVRLDSFSKVISGFDTVVSYSLTLVKREVFSKMKGDFRELEEGEPNHQEKPLSACFEEILLK